MNDNLVVNEHYLDRVVAVAETATVEATEDILSGNGIKLVAKGARIDRRVKDRLLEHKLRKPLETSVRVVDGVATRPIDQVARALLDEHLLLAGVCGKGIGRLVTAELRDLRLSTPLESALSIYAAQGPHKLEHAVGVALLAASTYHDMPQGGPAGVQKLMLAGLMHDVGELYIHPDILKPDARLTAAQWRHIAAHPVIGAHVLREMPGAGPKVADAVLYHHERLDGFGYPHGLRGADVPIASQVLALAEMLMALIESGRSPGERASVAVKLIPGEYDRLLLDRVAAAARACGLPDTAPPQQAQTDGVEALALRVAALADRLQGLHGMRSEVQALVEPGSPALRELMAHVLDRCERIRSAFSSTGLDAHGPHELRERLAAMDRRVHAEVDLVLREIEWRLREVQREVSLRRERLPTGEAAQVGMLLGKAKALAVRSARGREEPLQLHHHHVVQPAVLGGAGAAKALHADAEVQVGLQ